MKKKKIIDNVAQDRINTLKRISGVEVSYYTRNRTFYFVFGPQNQPLKTVCTYRKARIFAEGVAKGRQLGESASNTIRPE